MADYMKEIAQRTKAGFGMIHRELLQWFRETQTGTLRLKNTLPTKNPLRSLKRKGSRSKNVSYKTLERKAITSGEKKGDAGISIKTHAGNEILISRPLDTLTKKNNDSDPGYDILKWDIETITSKDDRNCVLDVEAKSRACQNIDNNKTTITGHKTQILRKEDTLHTYQNIDSNTTLSDKKPEQALGADDKIHTYEQIDNQKAVSVDVSADKDKRDSYETIWDKPDPPTKQPLQSTSENNQQRRTDTKGTAISPRDENNSCDENEYIEPESTIDNSAMAATVESFITNTTPIRPGPRPFLGYTVEEVVDCFEECALYQLADICKAEKLDGEYFRSLSDEDLTKEPFCLTCFHISKVRKIIAGWRPKRTPVVKDIED